MLAKASSRARRWSYTTGLLQQEQRHDEVLALLRAADLVPRILASRARGPACATLPRSGEQSHGAQLIFNSHEASLLGDSGGERVLGRDQVWFAEKGHDGARRLYPLSDLSPKGDEAIGRRYLAGRYGATPILSSEEFTEVALSAAGEDG